MRARPRGKKVWYYYDAGGRPRKEIALGCDYPIAIKKWAEFEIEISQQLPQKITFQHAAERYIKEVVPTKSPATQKDNHRELKQLNEFFSTAPLDQIEPIHIRQYIDQRTQLGAPIRAKREKALFSHIYNKAREWGYTANPNPCAGIRGTAESGRRHIYITDRMYQDVHDHADQPLRDAMDMAYLTGQRPSDVLKMTEHDINDGALCITQNKTGTKLRISIEGELATLLSRIRDRKTGYKIRSLYIIVNQSGQPVSLRTLQDQFNKARTKAGINPEAFQFRDLRAKAGTDKAESSGDIRQAQKQLGHRSVTMTEHYVRSRKGEKVKPTR
jgi:integrase